MNRGHEQNLFEAYMKFESFLCTWGFSAAVYRFGKGAQELSCFTANAIRSAAAASQLDWPGATST